MSVATVDGPCADARSARPSRRRRRAASCTCCRSRSAVRRSRQPRQPLTSRRPPRHAPRNRRASADTCRLDARAGRKCAVEAHVDEAALDVVPRLLADDEVAADVEQDVVEPRLDAEIAKAAAVELALSVQRRHEDRVGRGLDRRLDEIGRGRQRAERRPRGNPASSSAIDRMRLPTMCVSEPMTPVTSVLRSPGRFRRRQ